VSNNAKLQWLVAGDTTPPKRNDGLDAGWDFYVPNFNENFAKALIEKNPGQPIKWSIVGASGGENDNEKFFIQLNPHQDILIPTYIHSRFDKDWVIKVDNKSGVSTGQKLLVGATIVDSSYEGEIHLHVINTSPIAQFISFGQKLAQAILIHTDSNPAEVYYAEGIEKFKEYKNITTAEKFYDGHESARKDKGFGEGTGKK
jgi:dUTPase